MVFPVSLVVVLVLGVALVWYGRSSRDPDTSPPRAGIDHWHSAIGFYVCDAFLPNLPPQAEDPVGIHSHGDGVIHIHPFLAASSGRNATFARFLETEGITFTNDELQLPGGAGDFREGLSPGCNGEPAELVMAKWARQSSDTPTVITEDFGKVKFLNDEELYTVAYVPVGFDAEKLPKPPTTDQLAALKGQVDPPLTIPPTTVAGTGTTVTGTDTTVAPTPTTAPAATDTTSP